jgi:hypothetical protein
MRVLVACEFSGIVREAFNQRGHRATSADLLPTEIPGDHYQGDVLEILDQGWDLMIAHPPCTHLAVSGARWFKDKVSEQKDAISFFLEMVNAPIQRTAIENPVSIMSTMYRMPDQIIQPWMFGHPETKATCLWLKILPELLPTMGFFDRRFVKGRDQRVFREPPGPDRWKNRSRTFPGIAVAMADQWGSLADNTPLGKAKVGTKE